MRMAVAIMVAVMLHALILVTPIPTGTIPPSLHKQPLQISLVTAPDPAPSATTLAHKRMPQHPPAHTTADMQKKPRKNTSHPAIVPRNTPTPMVQPRQSGNNTPAFNQRQRIRPVVHTPAALHQHSPAEKTRPLAGRQQHEPIQKQYDHQSADGVPVPEDIQAHLLMHVSYPRQARRHGWQGKVTLQFDVQQHMIRHVTVLTSSGYPVLDRAAYRALSHTPHIALADGVYRVPVVFRLQ